MTLGCALPDPDAGIAQTLVGTVDCFIKGNAQAGYANLLGPGSIFSQALTIALTLYVASIGYRMIFGRGGVSVREMAPRMVLIGAVLALSSGWSSYQVLVFDLLTDGPQQLASAVAPESGRSAGIMARVDVVADRLVQISDSWAASTQTAAADAAAAAQADGNDTQAEADTDVSAAEAAVTDPAPVVAIPRASLGPNMLLLSALLILLASAGVLAIAKILLGLLLMVGPVFVTFALFGATRGLTAGWARACLLLALVPVFTLVTVAAALTLLEPLVTEMAVAAQNDDYALRAAVSILVATLVTAAVCGQLFGIARTITGAWKLFAAREAEPAPATPESQPVVLLSPDAGNGGRVQNLVNAIERGAIAGVAANDTAPRAIVIPQVMPVAPVASGASSPSTRRIGAPRATSTRASLRPVRHNA